MADDAGQGGLPGALPGVATFGEDTAAAKPDIASKIFFRIVEEFTNSGLKVETGIFGSDMDVEINNYGPMTLIIDSKT